MRLSFPTTISASSRVVLRPVSLLIASPYLRRVGSCVILFEACSAFTFVTACMLAESPRATLYTRGFSSFVTSTTALIATGWSEPVPGRVYPAVDQRLSRRTQLPVYQSDRSLREPQTIHPKNDINLPARGIPMNHRKCASILAALLAAALSVSSTVAQVLYGSALGTLQDQTGAVIAGAAVTMTSKDTGASREAL